MAEVVINGKKYDLEKLPKEAVDLINSIRFVDSEVQKLQNEIRVMMAARNFYVQQLQGILEKIQQSSSDDKIQFS